MLLNEPEIVGKYHEEYLEVINRYSNVKRPSIFVRYLKIYVFFFV